MEKNLLEPALKKLQDEFPILNWIYYDFPAGNENEKMYKWPGIPEEEIMLTVHKSSGKQELFHRHDFFYFNYTYKGEYNCLSCKYNNKIIIREKELYAGQPFAGHALCVLDNQEVIVIGVLIQKEVFFRSFLPMLSANSKLLHFFLDPATKEFSDEFIHFKIEDDGNIRALLEMMVIEYAYKKEDTQNILKPLVLSFLMLIARQYSLVNQAPSPEKISEKILEYIGEHFDTVTLKELSKRFYYHPNYISSLLTRELGKSFSEILLEQRMKRAVVLLKGTTLPVEEIAFMLGYSNSSNFYKAFKEYYKMTPRKYMDSISAV
jgi:AraC-like DNA-binding protein